jgi:hypothetical protein
MITSFNGLVPAGIVSDAGTRDAEHDARPSADGPAGDEPAASQAGIYCGNTVCAVGQQSCCVSNNAPPNPTFACQSASPANCQDAGGVSVECDDAVDCPGQFCCGTQQGNVYVYVRCQPHCANDYYEYQFCNPAAQVGECPAGFACVPSGLLPGYYVCN